MKEDLPPRLKAFFLRQYSRQKPYKTLMEPVFVTYKRRATVFLGSRFSDNLRLCRQLKNQGYTITLRKKPIPTFKVEDPATGEMLVFSWRSRCQVWFGPWWWN